MLVAPLVNHASFNICALFSSVCLTDYLSVYFLIYISQSTCLSFYLCPSVYHIVHNVSVCLSGLYLYLSSCLSDVFYVFLLFYLPLSLSRPVFLSVRLSIMLPDHLCLYVTSLCLSYYLSALLFISVVFRLMDCIIKSLISLLVCFSCRSFCLSVFQVVRLPLSLHFSVSLSCYLPVCILT